MTDDWTLVARGTPAAFAELYRRHRRDVHAFVFVRVRHRELAEDLTADTFVRALAHLGTVQDTGHAYGAWLVTIAGNLIRDHWKRAATRYEAPTGELPPDLIPTQRCGSGEVDTVLDAGRLLRGPIAAVTDRDRRLITQRHLLGLSWAEIAQGDDRNVQAAKSQELRARQKLRRAIELGGAA